MLGSPPFKYLIIIPHQGKRTASESEPSNIGDGSGPGSDRGAIDASSVGNYPPKILMLVQFRIRDGNTNGSWARMKIRSRKEPIDRTLDLSEAFHKVLRRLSVRIGDVESPGIVPGRERFSVKHR